MILIPLYGKQESQESILESWNQAKILKDSESRRRKFRVADPSPYPTYYVTYIATVVTIEQVIHTSSCVADLGSDPSLIKALNAFMCPRSLAK